MRNTRWRSGSRRFVAGAASLAIAAAAAIGITAAASGGDNAEQLARLQAPAQFTKAGPDSNISFDATLPNGRRVTPAGVSTQVGENPLGEALSADGRFLIVTADDERNGGRPATGVGGSDEAANGSNKVAGGYVLNVVRTADMQVVSSATAPSNPVVHKGPSSPRTTSPLTPATPVAPTKSQSDSASTFWLGVAVKPDAAGTGYTVYASGGPNDVVDVFALDANGVLTLQKTIPVTVPDPNPSAADVKPNSGLASPGGLWLSPDGAHLYFVNNNGFTVSVIDTATNTEVGTPAPVGFFPYTAVQSADGSKLYVSNWGVADRAFNDTYKASYDPATHAGDGSPFIGGVAGNLFANPVTDPARNSSLSVLDVNGSTLTPAGSIPLGLPIDGVEVAGGTHPSALAIATSRGQDALYVADANEDRIAVVDTRANRLVGKFGLPSILIPGRDQGDVAGQGQGPLDEALGTTPNGLAVSPDQTRLYVAEAGLNAVAVFDISRPFMPRFLGRIPTGWYPTGVAVSRDGSSLYVINAKGFGNPHNFQGAVPGSPDVNLVFGTAQKIDLQSLDLAAATRQVADNTFRRVDEQDDHGFAEARDHIKHVIFILRENKSYDSYFGDDAVLNARGADGLPAYAAQFGGFVPNTKKLAETFAVGDNAYADSEESDAGHFFALAGQSTDYQQKTLLNRFTRPFINTKNEDPENYPLRGFLFNHFARAGLSYRDYGDLVRLSGYDDYSHPNACSDDPYPGCDPATEPRNTTAPTVGLGGNFTEATPALAVLKDHIDPVYPGWNVRITDQRRANEFIKDYGALIDEGKAPAFTFVWLPNDHTGSAGGKTPQEEVADNDLALGRIVDFVSHSPIWKSSAIFVTADDAQGSADHVNAHRSYTFVVSPWAKRATVVNRLSSTVSIPKTIEEIFGLPAMSLGDLVANDLSDYFTDTPDYTPYDAIGAAPKMVAGPASMRILSLGSGLTASGFDQNTTQLGALETLFWKSVQLSRHQHAMSAPAYRAGQDVLYRQAQAVVGKQ